MTNYKLKNYYNRKLQWLELRALYPYRSIKSLILHQGHYSHYKNPKTQIIYGHFKAKQANRRNIHNLSLLFNFSDKNSTYLFFYYLVVAPRNAKLTRTRQHTYTFKNLDGTNPYIDLNKGYTKLHRYFNKINRKHNQYTQIYREHIETTKKAITAHTHDNLIIVSTHPLDKLDLRAKVNDAYNFNDLDINVDNLPTESDADNVVEYSEETDSQFPYCKHNSKGKQQINDFELTPKKLQRAYLFGILNATKGITLSHTTSIKSIINNINKVNLHHHHELLKQKHNNKLIADISKRFTYNLLCILSNLKNIDIIHQMHNINTIISEQKQTKNNSNHSDKSCSYNLVRIIMDNSKIIIFKVVHEQKINVLINKRCSGIPP